MPQLQPHQFDGAQTNSNSSLIVGKHCWFAVNPLYIGESVMHQADYSSHLDILAMHAKNQIHFALQCISRKLHLLTVAPANLVALG
jgi:hypothetical protein